jgi:hypothetical protein
MRWQHCSLLSRAVLALSLLLMAATGSFAARPVVTGITPTGVVRGESTTITLSGARLSDARQVLMELPGIEVTEVKPIDNSKVEVTLKAAEDLAPGLYPFRLVTATGVANLRLLSVGALPVVAEAEPNSDFESPQKIDMNVTVTGVIKREDEDFFAVDLKKGQRIHCEVEGVRLAYYPRNNDGFFDPYLAILDSERFEQATSDDAPLLLQDALCAFTAPEDGTYVIAVRDSSYGGANNAHYRLHVGDFPRPVAVVPAGGQPGETIQARFVGAAGETWESSLELPNLADFDYPVSVKTDSGIAPSPNVVRVLPMPVNLESEPNDNVREPNVASNPLPAAFCGVIEKEGDMDAFAFEAKKGQRIVTQLFARSLLRSPLDAVVDIYDANIKRVGGNDDQGGPDSYAEFTAPRDGRYIVRVRDHLGNGGAAYSYRVEVEVAKPELTLSLPEERRDEAMSIEVPRGGHRAFMVNAARKNFRGDLELGFENLPDGVTVTKFPMPANRPTIPIMLSASADAPLEARLVDLFARPTSGSPDITGHLVQRHKLVAGRNRVDVWGYDSDRAAIAVAEQAPVTLEVAEPTAPIVRTGAAELKVIAHRREGFDAEIPVRLLYTPPGIGTNNSRKIPKGKSEITIPITANTRAATGVWPIFVTGSVNIGNGSMKVSTPPVELAVEDVFFSFNFNKASVEQGAKSQVLVNVEVARPFEGTAEVKLVGLPAGVSSPEPTQPIAADTTEVTFPIEIAADARPGNHKTLVCQAVVHSPGGDIRQTQGTGELQVNKPLPAPEKKEPKAEQPAEKKEAPPKPLSRIEQLRQQKKQQGDG